MKCFMLLEARCRYLKTEPSGQFWSSYSQEVMASCDQEPVDWLVCNHHVRSTVEDVRGGLQTWPGGKQAAERKQRLFDDRLVELALSKLKSTGMLEATTA
jgi:hypothetical protein